MASATTAKVFVSQVLRALRSPARSTPTIDGIDCPRLWVQVRVCVSGCVGGRACV